MRVEYRSRFGQAGGAGRMSACGASLFFNLFLVVGLAMLGGSGYSFFHTRAAIAEAVTTGGIVIELIDSRDSDGDTVYYPRVRYTTREGKTLEFTGSVGSKPAAFDIGEAVTVLYDRERPTDARIDAFFELWLLSIILSGMGIVFTGIGAVGVAGGLRSRDGFSAARAALKPTESAAAPAIRAVDRRPRD
jgi:hypothetical protein